ncbi:MarR family transcriptional regulator [Actinosynnema sp. NPDC023794]
MAHADHVDVVIEQWCVQQPGLDVSSMAVTGRLIRLTRLVTTALRGTFDPHGLDAASFDILAALTRAGPPHRSSPGHLMRASMVTSGAITQRLDRLESRELVTRAPSDLDGRGVRVALTAAGLALTERVLPDHLETSTRLLVALSRAERDELADVLRNLLVSLGDGSD